MLGGPGWTIGQSAHTPDTRAAPGMGGAQESPSLVSAPAEPQIFHPLGPAPRLYPRPPAPARPILPGSPLPGKLPTLTSSPRHEAAGWTSAGTGQEEPLQVARGDSWGWGGRPGLPPRACPPRAAGYFRPLGHPLPSAFAKGPRGEGDAEPRACGTRTQPGPLQPLTQALGTGQVLASGGVQPCRGYRKWGCPRGMQGRTRGPVALGGSQRAAGQGTCEAGHSERGPGRGHRGGRV